MTDHVRRPVEGADAAFEHLNSNYADSVLFLASHVAATPLTDAELIDADHTGVDVRVRGGGGGGGERMIRIPFAEPVDTIAEVQARLLSRLLEARTDQPEGPLTSIERDLAGQDDIPTRTVVVTAVRDIGPGMREITFGGMGGHRVLGPDDFFLVIRPKAGQEHLLDGDVTFRDLRDLPPDDAPAWAYYTCRRWRPESDEIDTWFVIHEHAGDISGWARHVEPGDRALLWGPRMSFDPPEGTTSLLLVGDETGLGAFAAILEQTDPAVAITVLVESDDGNPVVDLPHRDGADVRWLARNGLERGTGTLLLDGVAGLALDSEGLYAYGAGESRLVTAVRKHLRHERNIPGAQVQMVGYWRRTE